MKGQEIKIIFKDDKAFIAPHRAMSLVNAGIPISLSERNFTRPSYWNIKVINFNESDNILFCEIVSYEVGETDFPNNQIALFSQLEKVQLVKYKSLDTIKLLKNLSGGRSSGDKPDYSQPSYFHSNREYFDPVKRQIDESFSMPLKKLNFVNGGVLGTKRLDSIGQTIEFEIPNDYIKEEFDAVKNYFGNILGKVIQIDVSVEMLNKEVVLIKAKSNAIGKIDEALIDELRIDILKRALKVKLEQEKSIFTVEEYLKEAVKEDFNLKALYTDENTFMDDVLKVTNSKHYHHLRYLSNKHCHKILNIRILCHPFAFIFLLEGNNNYYIAWETINTAEATYLWPISKNVELRSAVEEIYGKIKLIKESGKMGYINSTKDNYERIYHDYSESVNGFLQWKSELELLAF